MSARPFERGGQHGWAHDEHHSAGTFHTYDHFDLGFLGPRRVHVFQPRHEGRFATIYLHDGDKELSWLEDFNAGHDETAWQRRFGEMVKVFFPLR